MVKKESEATAAESDIEAYVKSVIAKTQGHASAASATTKQPSTEHTPKVTINSILKRTKFQHDWLDPATSCSSSLEGRTKKSQPDESKNWDPGGEQRGTSIVPNEHVSRLVGVTMIASSDLDQEDKMDVDDYRTLARNELDTHAKCQHGCCWKVLDESSHVTTEH